MVAALYVQTGGVYYGLDGVDPWDEARDARKYPGPWPVVAHPPCARWCALAGLVESLHGYKVGDDDGCFEAALSAVRRFGGVLEHPAYSRAWGRFGLPQPSRHGWGSSLFDPGITSEIDQAAYGHPARKRTWLYAVGIEPLLLDWTNPPVTRQVSSFTGKRGRVLAETERVRPALAASTPEPFRDVLLAMARSAQPASVPLV